MQKKIVIRIAVLSPATLSLALSSFAPPFLPFDVAWIAIVLCGAPIVKNAVLGLITRLDIKADVLVSMALIGAVLIGEDFAAGEVALIMQIGSLLEDLTVARARRGIEKLVRLTPRTARLLQDGTDDLVPAETVRPGDLVRILPGETIPVDGVVASGWASVNEAVITGEPLPVDKNPGDTVLSGTVCAAGSLDLRASRAGADSSMQRLVRLVQSADAGKARIVHLADRWASWVVITAVLAAGLAWWLGRDPIRAVTVLVVFCPCSLVLATPTAITAAIGNAARRHFLVREGDALERLAQVDKVCFDKTGTLTFGTPQVVAVQSQGALAEAQLFALAAAVEARSEHPLGRAIVQGFGAAHPATALPEATDFAMTAGRGVRATVHGQPVLAGTQQFLHDAGVRLPDGLAAAIGPYLNRGCSVIHLAAGGAYGGFIALADTIRPDAAEVIARIRAAGVELVLLTGDQEEAAQVVAGALGIDQVLARQLPQNKLLYIDGCRKKGEYVCMMGDGINDAPALKAAHVGIAMGGIGSDIACDAADIVLAQDDIRELPQLLALSRRMMRTIKYNLSFSMLLNFAAIALAMSGLLNPISGALVHNAGSVFVIANSALLLGWKEQKADRAKTEPLAAAG